MTEDTVISTQIPNERDLTVRFVPIADLKPYPKNPKKHNLPAIKESIRRYKMTKPVLVQKGTMQIIAGHGRVQALKELGYTQVPIIELDMDSKEAKGYGLSDNSTTISGGWDMELLKLNVQEVELETPGLLMADLGIDPDTLLDGKIGTDMQRPAFAGLTEKYGSKKCDKGDEYYFYIEFYGQPERFEQLKAKLAMVGKHEIDPNEFEKLVNGDAPTAK